jgi:hypothetical protein
MKHRMLAFSRIVSYPPLGVSYCEAGPQMVVSLRNGFAMEGISGSRMNVMLPWNIATALVEPCGRMVQQNVLSGI